MRRDGNWYGGDVSFWPSEFGPTPPEPGVLYCACGCDFYDDEGSACPDCGCEGHSSESAAAAEWEDFRNHE